MTGTLLRPYPSDLYRGTTGEVSGWIRPNDAEPGRLRRGPSAACN